MSMLKEWVIQLRYPYTAGIIALMWIGGTSLAIIRPEIPGQLLVSSIAAATLILAMVGFSSNSR